MHLICLSNLKEFFGNNDQGEKEGLKKVCEEKDFLFQDKLEIKISDENFYLLFMIQMILKIGL